MASAYPGALDSFTNPASTDNLNTTGVLHDVQHSDVNNAIVAIETELGVNPKGAFATVAAVVAALLAPSKAKVTRTAVQTLTQATDTPIQFTSETYDADNWHDNTTNNTRLTCPTGKGGSYLIVAKVEIAANSTGLRSMTIYKNGTVIVGETSVGASPTPSRTIISCIDTVELIPTDYISLNVYQSSGGSLDVTIIVPPALVLVYIGP